MGANRYEAESNLRRIATKLLVTAIRNGYKLGHFNRKIIRCNSSALAPYSVCKIVSLHSFKQISRWFDDYNNQHSPQQGVGKFDNEYTQVVRNTKAVAI